jgi:hypothetical protein
MSRQRDRGARGSAQAGQVMRRVIPGLLLGLAMSVLGCATVGHSFPPERVERIELGTTTKSELVSMFGTPYRRGVEDGDSTWTFLHYKFRLFGTHLRTRDLYVVFDPSGRVKSYTYNSDMDE